MRRNKPARGEPTFEQEPVDLFPLLKRREALHMGHSNAVAVQTKLGSMSTVLDEVTSETVDAVHIRRRVDDWEKRLNGLYSMVGEWLPDGWQARQGKPVIMHEELMRKFGVATKRLPTLELRDQAGHSARLEPHAIWIIGENGRVDLKRDGPRYFLVDMAENFARPNWEAVRSKRRCDREAVTREWLRRILP